MSEYGLILWLVGGLLALAGLAGIVLGPFIGAFFMRGYVRQ